MSDFSSFDQLDEYLSKLDSKIIHAIWFRLSFKSKTLFKKFDKFRYTWRIKNPDYFYYVWNRQYAREFVKKKFPEYLDMYDSYPYDIQRIDVLRYFLLYEYGGFYTDMDMECLRSISEIQKKFPKDIYFIETPNKVFGLNISNMFLYSKKKHPFWKRVFIELEKNKDSPWYYTKHLTVMCTTGPLFLDKVFSRCMYRLSLNTYPVNLFNPKGLLHEGEIFKPTKEIYTIHWGEGSWESGDSTFFIFIYKNLKLLVVVIFILLLPLILSYFKSK